MLTNEERMEKWFQQAEELEADVPTDWELRARPCRFQKILDDRKAKIK